MHMVTVCLVLAVSPLFVVRESVPSACVTGTVAIGIVRAPSSSIRLYGW
jgi:hypothetical protein